MKTSEEFGQALQNIIDRYRQDLSILLEGYEYDEVKPADLVALYQHDPTILLQLHELPLDDDDLCHMEGESTLDKLSNLFRSGIDLLSKAETTVDKIKQQPQVAVETPATQKSRTRTLLIAGVFVAVLLAVILIFLKRKK